MKRSILGILELIAVAGSRTVEWVTAKGGVSFGEEEEEEEEERKGGGGGGGVGGGGGGGGGGLVEGAGGGTVGWVTARGGVGFGVEEVEEGDKKGGGDCWSWWRCGLVSSDKASLARDGFADELV